MSQTYLSSRVNESRTDQFYSKSNIEYLEKIISDMKTGKAKFEEHDLIEDDDK